MGLTMTTPPAHGTRLERILGVPLADDAMRQWPQSGEVINGRQRIGEELNPLRGSSTCGRPTPCLR